MTGNFTPKRPLSHTQTELSEKMLLEVRKKDFKTVSFKMMNTLVITPFSEKEDLFLLMEKEFQPSGKIKKTFTELRIAAGEAAEKKCEMKGCVTLDMIYGIFMKLSGVSAEEKERLMQRECELLQQYSLPRECGKKLFREAKKQKKRVIVTAPTFYPRSVVINILERCGYGSYDDLIIPSEQNFPDSAAAAYIDMILKKSGVSANKLLHIGPDVTADVEAPILRGAKALLMQPAVPLMVRSGRLRGYIQAKHIYDYDTEKFFALHCVLGMAAVYGFDTPQNKLAQSDFCGDSYMLGFIILGALSLCRDFSPSNELQREIISALENNPEAVYGKEDFSQMLRFCFDDILDDYGSEGCTLPLEFLEKYAYSADRNALSPYISTETAEKWSKSVKEPSLAPVYAGKAKKNSLARFADKLFPPETRVRSIVDDILSKGKKF